MEFFIALFGGIYWIWKLARADTQKKRDKISDECRRTYLTSLTDKQAESLRGLELEVLILPRLTSLTDNQAESLSKVEHLELP